MNKNVYNDKIGGTSVYMSKWFDKRTDNSSRLASDKNVSSNTTTTIN